MVKPVLIFSLPLFFCLFSCQKRDEQILPLAISQDADKITETLSEAGIDGIVRSAGIQIPISNFSGIEMLSPEEILLRIRTGDPRQTKLTVILPELFSSTGQDNRTYQIIYIPPGSYNKALKLVSGYDYIAIADDTTGIEIIPLAILLVFSLFVIIGKPRSLAGIRILPALSWFPFIFFGFSGFMVLAALSVQQIAIAGIQILYRKKSGFRKRWSQSIPVIPFLVLSCLLCVIQSGIILPLILSIISMSLSLYLASVLLDKKMEISVHMPPVFNSINPANALKNVLKKMQPGLMALLLLSIVQATIDFSLRLPAYSGSRSRGVYLREEAINDGSEDILALHIAYQKALSYARLGEAAWGRTDYTVLDESRAQMDKEYPEAMEIEKLARNNIFYRIQISDRQGKAGIYGKRLETGGRFHIVLIMSALLGCIGIILALYWLDKEKGTGIEDNQEN